MWTGSKRGIAAWLALGLGLGLWTTLAAADGLSGGIGSSFGGGISGLGVTPAAGGTPGGSSGQLQWNNAGAFAGLTMSGDATLNTSTGVLTIAPAAVALGDMVNLAANSIIGNNTGSAAAPLALTVAQVTALIASGSGGGTTNFLRADGTWAAPGGGGVPGGATTQVQFNNAGAFGGDSGFTYAGTGKATLALGTITTNLKALTITGTWNAAGVVFDAPLFMNIVNTASALGSVLIDLQVGGTSAFNVVPFASGRSQINLGLTAVSIASGQFNGEMALGSGVGSYTSGHFYLDGNNHWVQVRSDSAYAWAADTNNSSSSAVDAKLYRQAAGIVGLHHGTLTSAAAFQVYNTSDVGAGAAVNFERGVFDWTTTANTLTIGTQSGGTGSARQLSISAQVVDLQILGTPIVRVAGTSLDLGNHSAIGSTTGIGFGGAGISVKAPLVWAFGNGVSADTSGWMQWGGQARVSADFSVTSSTTLVNVTGLSVSVQAGRTYQFQAELYVTDAAAGGVQAAIAGTATATALQYTGYTLADNAIKAKTNATALATAVGSTVTTETAGIIVKINGTITVNAAGTLTVQMAQNTSNATATIAKRGSWLLVNDMP